MRQSKGKSDKYVVCGRVTYSDPGRPAAGVRVTAMDADLLFDDKLGEATTDENGRFNIVYGVGKFRDLFERVPDIYLIVRDQGGAVLTTTREAVVRNAGRSQEIHVQLPGGGPIVPVHVVAVGGLEVDRKAFEALKPDDVLMVARSALARKPDKKAISILRGLHPSLADDLARRKLCGTPVSRLLFDIVRIKEWPREVLLDLEEIFTGGLRLGFLPPYSCGPFTINYDTTGAAAVETTVSVTDITIPGTTTVVGTTTDAAGSPPNYIQRLCFWLQRAYAAYTDAPFGLRTPSGTIAVYVIIDGSCGHGGKNFISIDHELSNDLLAWVAVHELVHVIQAEYGTAGSGGGWQYGILEGGALLAEDTVIDPVNRYAAEADNFFGEGTLRHPETSLMSLSYKLSLFLKYVAEQQSSRVNTVDEPLIGVETYRKLLETFDAQTYTTAAFSQAVNELPWYQSFYEFGYMDAARLDETSSETVLGNFWMACYLKDLGVAKPDRRFDFMEDEEASLADDIYPGGAPGPIGTLCSVALQADVSLSAGGSVTLSSGAGSTVDPFAARFYKLTPSADVDTVRLEFSAGDGFTRPLVQVALIEPGNVVRDILRSDRTNWSRTIANDRSKTKLDHLLVIVAGSDTGGTFTLCVKDVPAAPDVMVTRWHHAAGTHYEIDSFGWAWTWVSPDIWVDTNMDCIADDEVHLNKNHKLFIRLRNQGNAKATSIQVEFWYQDASGGLSDAAWEPVRNAAGHVQELTGLTLAAQSTSPVPPAAGANAWCVDWAPSGNSQHFCVRAVVTVPGDPNRDNKRCVSNFGNVVESAGFLDLTLVRRAHLNRHEDVKVLVIPRTRGRYGVSRMDLERLNAKRVKAGVELVDELRFRRVSVEGRQKPEARGCCGDERQPGLARRSHRAEVAPDPWGQYPTDSRALPPGIAQVDLVTIAHVVNGRPVGGFTWAIRHKER